MRILHIIPSYVPAYHTGGPVVSVHSLNKWLAKLGHDVTVYATDIPIKGRVPLCREVLLDGVKVFYFPGSFPRIWEFFPVFFFPIFFPKHWEYSRALHKKLAKTARDFDVIHITATFRFNLMLGAYYARKSGIPYVISPRGNLMSPLELKSAAKKLLYLAFIEKKNLKRAAAIHFTVPKERDEYVHYRLPLSNYFIIPNGIDVEEFDSSMHAGFENELRKRFGFGKDKKIILFLGRISWKKGFDTLIPAFAQVLKKESETVLVIAGSDDGGYRKKVKGWIAEHGISESVFFTSAGKEDKADIFRSADVFVLPSFSENFGIAVVEAMCASRPVVITEGVGISPYVRDAGAGIVIKKDINELTQAMVRLLRDPVSARRMGEKGRRLVEEKFSIPRIAEEWVKAYRSLISKKK